MDVAASCASDFELLLAEIDIFEGLMLDSSTPVPGI